MNREDLDAALESLAKAHGSSELISAMRSVQRTVRKTRRIGKSKLGNLPTIIDEAVGIRLKLKADGASEADLATGLEATVRSVWPFTREWHYKCDACHDCGLQIFLCTRGRRCNGISMRSDGPREEHGKHRRLCALNPDSDHEHEYGEPCLCAAGARFRPKPRPEASEFTDAGKTPKRSGPTRFGR